MGRKKIILFIVLVSSMLLFAGCNLAKFGNAKDNTEENSEVGTLAPDDEADSTSTKDKKTPDKEEGKEKADNTKKNEKLVATPIAPNNTIELAIYTVNRDTAVTEPITVSIPEDTELTPEFIVDKVVESMKDRSLDVGVKSVTPKDKAIIVDFAKDKAPLIEMASSYEGAILDAISMSLLDDLKDYNDIIIRAEGGDYISGQVESKADEPYLSRKK